MIKLFPIKYMMATKAEHEFAGDISREEPDLCQVSKEADDFYVGSWVTGFGFIDVKFPKETTRELTDAESEYYDGREIGIPGSWAYELTTKLPEPKEPVEIPKECLIVEKRRIPKDAKLVECYETNSQYVIIGEVDDEDESHNCDEMGCGSFSHVVARFKKK